GTPAREFIKDAPVFKTPNKKADSIIPIGFPNPNNATAIPLNPSLGKAPNTNKFPKVPNPLMAPPNPASPPLISIDKIIFFLSLIPAYLEASGFKPTALISKPAVVYFMKNQ